MDITRAYVLTHWRNGSVPSRNSNRPPTPLLITAFSTPTVLEVLQYHHASYLMTHTYHFRLQQCHGRATTGTPRPSCPRAFPSPLPKHRPACDFDNCIHPKTQFPLRLSVTSTTAYLTGRTGITLRGIELATHPFSISSLRCPRCTPNPCRPPVPGSRTYQPTLVHTITRAAIPFSCHTNLLEEILLAVGGFSTLGAERSFTCSHHDDSRQVCLLFFGFAAGGVLCSQRAPVSL